MLRIEPRFACLARSAASIDWRGAGMNAADLIALAERCEKLAADCQHLWAIDKAIFDLIPFAELAPHVAGIPSYTTSLDAALTLVPDGWRIGQLEENWRSGRWHCHVTPRPTAALIAAFDAGKTIGYDSQEAEAAAPALALTAAALRARAASVDTDSKSRDAQQGSVAEGDGGAARSEAKGDAQP